MVGAIIVGLSTAASFAWQAQPAGQPSTTSNQGRGEPPEAQAPSTQFLDRDGNPLPSDIQLDLKKQFRAGLPPVKNSDATKANVPSRAARSGDDGEIIVERQRPRGSVTADIPPERTFGLLEIDAYGASNIGELIQSLGPQVSSSRGRGDGGPVTLLNGQRVSSFTEIAEIPSEAIERMEVFPEELALRYGYRADQKVVNIITFEKFHSQLGQLGFSLPTGGGYNTAHAEANYFAIHGSTRFDFGAEYDGATSLRESDRHLAQPGGTDAGGFRTLLPATERLTANGLISGTLFADVSTTLNGRFEVSGAKDLLGRSATGALARDTDTRVAHLGTTWHGATGKWLWNFTGNYDHLRTDVITDVGSATGVRDRARSVNAFANANLVLSGSLVKLPTGPVSTTIRGSVEHRDFNGASLRGGVDQQAKLSRDSGAVQINLNVPIAGRRSRSAALLGDLSVNANLELGQFSDFGTLRTFGYGLNWSPVKAVNFIASATIEQGAPTIEQLGAPLIETPNVRTFDFSRREVVDITQQSGGNPDLRLDDRHVLRLGLNARPLATTDLTLSADYVSTRVDHPIASFPIVTPEIEDAFPERFTRGPDGRLLRIDGRSLNFAESHQKQLRWGVSFVRPLGRVEPWMRSAPVRSYSSEAEARAAAPVGTIVAMVQPGSAVARRLEDLSSRLYVNVYHTWQLQDDILVREGLPKLDLLNGAAIDILGGRRRHRLELQAGAFKGGLGARITANWQSGTTVHNPDGRAGDLAFSDLATVNINLFANLMDAFGNDKMPHWLKGARVTLGITNLFSSRPRVRDITGSTPLSYQSAYLDPLGRSINLNLRKVF